MARPLLAPCPRRSEALFGLPSSDTRGTRSHEHNLATTRHKYCQHLIGEPGHAGGWSMSMCQCLFPTPPFLAIQGWLPTPPHPCCISSASAVTRPKRPEAKQAQNAATPRHTRAALFSCLRPCLWLHTASSQRTCAANISPDHQVMNQVERPPPQQQREAAAPRPAVSEEARKGAGRGARWPV